MSIVLHIERLVLDEALLGGEHAGSVRDALERELAQRLAQPDAVDTLRDLGAVAALPPATRCRPPCIRSRGWARASPAAVQQGLSVPSVTRIASREH